MNQALETRERIISFVKSKGPVLPYQIGKEIKTDIIMASAHLSELVSSNILKISNTKVGGSPLYYIKGQENLLQKYSSNLHEKERRAYEFLSQKKVLEDSSLEPLTRVALREIKDFAVQLNIRTQSKNFIFWKWYLCSDEEAGAMIKSFLENADEQSQKIQTHNEIEIGPEKSAEAVIEQKTQQEQKESIAAGAITEKNNEGYNEKELEVKMEAKQEMQQKAEVKVDNTAIPQKPPVLQSKLKTTASEHTKAAKQDIKDDLYSSLISFFGKNSIEVLSFEIIKKNSDIEFIVEIPSAFGNLQYYCKSKNKKRISDSDLSNAYVKGQLKKLPVLFLSKGELSKKAEEMLKSELKGINFKKL